jgi:hypothetical protein
MIFKGQGIVEFGSANYAPTELAPAANNNYDDETAMFTNDPALVGAFETQFDKMWHDALPYTEAGHSLQGDPPYLVNWYDACPAGGGGDPNCDFQSWWPQHTGDLCPGGPQPMNINTDRLEPDRSTPPGLSWAQGSYPGDFNGAMANAINAEPSGGEVDLQVYRLSEPAITDALIGALNRGTAVKLVVDGNQYEGAGGYAFPEYELTHYNIDRLWAAGVTNIVLSQHPWIDGVSHMKSSNFTQHFERDHDYFVTASGAGAKPAIYNALVSCFQSMYTDTPGTCVPNGGGPHFIPFAPSPAVWVAGDLVSPGSGDTVSTTPTLIWNRAAWSVYYDVYLGEDDPSNLVHVGTVNHDLSENYPPQQTYSWSLGPLDPGRTYYWQIRARTLAPGVVASSAMGYFTTTGASGSLPPGWSHQDVGPTGAAGNASYSTTDGTFIVTGAGADIWAPPDAFQYVYENQPLAGDGQITARVKTIQNTNGLAKAGIMFRVSLDPSDAFVMLDVNPGTGNIEFMQRATSGGQTSWLAGTTQAAPVWLKLVRSNSVTQPTVTGYFSTDGSSWTTVGNATMGGAVLRGLIVSSHVQGVTNTSTFNGVSSS